MHSIYTLLTCGYELGVRCSPWKIWSRVFDLPYGLFDVASFLRKRGQSETEHSAPVNVGHVRLAHGAFVRSTVFTVAILAQGTNRGDALCAALLLRRVGSNPMLALFFSSTGNCVQIFFWGGRCDVYASLETMFASERGPTSGLPMARLCVPCSSP